jgi:hypothetical protein
MKLLKSAALALALLCAFAPAAASAGVVEDQITVSVFGVGYGLPGHQVQAVDEDHPLPIWCVLGCGVGGGGSGGLGGVANASAPARTEGAPVVNFSFDLQNQLRVVLPGSVSVTGTFWQATQPVSGTFWQTTQPVSIAALPALATGSNTIGTVNLGTLGGAATQTTLASVLTGIGAPGSTACASPSSTCTVIQLLQAAFASLIDTTPVGVTASSLPLPSGAATSAKQCTLDANGACAVPQAGTANRILTATSLTANTNTSICPTATNPVATEIYFTTAGVGVGLNGQTLTGAAPTATATSSPDFVSVAGQIYVAPAGIANAITAYGAAGVVRCIQTTRP